ncbi:hypothetical protein AVO45_13440 [Ruegeria marisrubri]|uniref:Uncharacterized protein n=1 Tax=Ruegeria marisrubri TaxID=1685379 RepID=A0A0X3TSS2_9RHOB|nr:hypothetical protein AVO45_13440 [Ruegeria marisrubri]
MCIGTKSSVSYDTDRLSGYYRVTDFQRHRVLCKMQIARIEHLPVYDVLDSHYIAKRARGTKRRITLRAIIPETAARRITIRHALLNEDDRSISNGKNLFTKKAS